MNKRLASDIVELLKTVELFEDVLGDNDGSDYGDLTYGGDVWFDSDGERHVYAYDDDGYDECEQCCEGDCDDECAHECDCECENDCEQHYVEEEEFPANYEEEDVVDEQYEQWCVQNQYNDESCDECCDEQCCPNHVNQCIERWNSHSDFINDCDNDEEQCCNDDEEQDCPTDYFDDETTDEQCCEQCADNERPSSPSTAPLPYCQNREPNNAFQQSTPYFYFEASNAPTDDEYIYAIKALKVIVDYIVENSDDITLQPFMNNQFFDYVYNKEHNIDYEVPHKLFKSFKKFYEKVCDDIPDTTEYECKLWDEWHNNGELI